MAEAEQEDYNAFGAFDTWGAVFFLGAVPAMMSYTFNDHEIVWPVLILGATLAVATLLALVQHFLHWNFIGKLVNVVAWLLTLLYIFIAVWEWFPEEDPLSPQAEGAPASELSLIEKQPPGRDPSIPLSPTDGSSSSGENFHFLVAN